ncbi:MULTISPECIES: hypothetical protein [Erysipelothrix]|uniref:hypothetical protein n=1 Tax=Erysipelothrix TaxID=1647 RepID=UPI00140D5A75|nr:MULTISPECIES: hypothetical protein [Erysipelothrix]MDV7678465.1 hypothetical protein [Erysipelothrix rhusiopathiae]WMT70165.1 hypothetical protein K0H77_01245 [Erysipelothrix rhusiopathiae]
MFQSVIASIGGATQGKSFLSFLTQIANGLLGIVSFVLGIALAVLIYQAMNAQKNGDTSSFNDKKDKAFIVLALAILSIAARAVF